MSTALHPCGYRNPLTGIAECDLPARLYVYPNGNEGWMCDGHAFAIEDLLKAAR